MEAMRENRRARFYFSMWILGAGVVQFVLLSCHEFPFHIAWKDALITTWLLLLIAQILYLIQHNYHPPRPVNLVNFGIVAVFTAIFQFLFNASTHALMTSEEWMRYVMPHVVTKAVVIFLILMLVSLYWWIQKNNQEQEKIRQQLLEKERALTKAELDNIHQQLQPHFLFNSLNSIGALTMLEPTEAHRMIQLLSSFLRGTLRKDVQQLVPLSEELAQVELYLEIEKVRFGHRLTTAIDCPAHCNDLQLPALILQPIIENAIKFGLYGQLDTILITIDITCVDNLLTVSVSSPYDPEFVSGSAGNGFGLASIRRRLSLFFQQNDLLTTSKDNARFTTTLSIPQL